MAGLFPILSLVFTSFTRPHPIHVTVSDVVIRDIKVEWNIRIYTDDLLLAIYGKHATPRQIGELADIERNLLKYLGKHVRLEQEGASVSWTIANIGQDPEAVSVTLAGHLPKARAPFTIFNNSLTEVYSDQKNIVNLAMGGKEWHYLFGKGDGPHTVTP